MPSHSTTPSSPGALRYVALVPAAGVGARMTSAGEGMPKQYLPLVGKPMIWHALHTLCSITVIERVYVVLSAEDSWWQDAQFASLAGKLRVLRCGGATRAASVRNGLSAIQAEAEADFVDKPDAVDLRVLVHDAARPCLRAEHVTTLIQAVAALEAGGLLAVPVADTLKRSSTGVAPCVAETVARDGLWQAQTPQLFPVRLLQEALDFSPDVTDEAGAVEAMGLQPLLVAADSTNFKVTYPRDLALAELILRDRFNERAVS